MQTILSQIQSPSDIKNMTLAQLEQLAREMRHFIIDAVATKEGHLGASLGVVELTIALHYVFDTPHDKLVWDVGHQAYGHKILTGRKDLFTTNRQKNGISGFPKRSESIYDAFGTGHSSTAISAVLGMAIAAGLNGDTDRKNIAVVGDASIASGMAFEGLNHAGVTNSNLLIILNDNAIGIDPSVGALKSYLTNVKMGKNPKSNNMIKSLNFDYTGPVDGHDLPKLIAEFQKLKDKKTPQFLHIITTKGKGLKQAEENQITYHAPGKFDKDTGELYPPQENLFPKFQDVFGWTLVELAEQNKKIIGITPAMPTGSSLRYLMERFPERGIDVGIAEQHAVTLAGGMATEGFTVFCAIYSTFLQRAYDQVVHDIALQNLPVIFCVDRAGLVGEDGATHQGVYDIAYLNAIPNIQILAPKNVLELRNSLYTLQLHNDKPVAIRYPRGRCYIKDWKQPFEEINFNEVEPVFLGTRTVILSTGTIYKNVVDALNLIDNHQLSYYHFVQIKPLNEAFLQEILVNYDNVITVEEGTVNGGFGSLIAQYTAQNFPDIRVKNIGVKDQFIEHATVQEQMEECGLDILSLKKYFSQFTDNEIY